MSATRTLTAALAAALLAAGPATAAFTGEARNTGNRARAVAVFKPRLGAAPSIAGDPRRAATLTTDDGVWQRQPASVTRVWLRCDEQGAGCGEIPGAAGTTYVATAADVGKRLRVRVLAVNAGGSAQATSAPTAPVNGVANTGPPASDTPPAIGGTPLVDEVLTVDPGTWLGIENEYRYEWLRCVEESACVAVAGENGSRFRLEGRDVGATFRVRVTASNDGGSLEQTTAATARVGRRAFTYTACADPDTGKGVGPASGPPPGFARAGYGEYTSTSSVWRCAAGTTSPEMSQHLTMNTYHSVSGVRYRYDVPPGVRMVGGVVYRALSFSSPLGVSFTATPSDAAAFGADTQVYGACWTNFSCFGLGDPAVRFGEANRQALISTSPNGFAYTLHCHTNGSLCQGSGWNALYGGDIRLEDGATPTLPVDPSGTLVTGEVLGPTAAVSLRAADAGAGLYRVRVLVDGTEVAAQVVAPNGGACADVNTANGDPYEFASHTPCATAFDGTLAFGTGAWPKGTHRLHVLLEDAGRNTVTLSKRTVRIGT